MVGVSAVAHAGGLHEHWVGKSWRSACVNRALARQAPQGSDRWVIGRPATRLPGTYLVRLDYPLDPLSCAHACETYSDLELGVSFTEPLYGAVLFHIDDHTKVLVTLGPGSEGDDEPIDTPFHFACWNTQANRGSLFEMTNADPSVLPAV